MNQNPLRRLRDFGQSVWLDFIRRQMITSGELQQLIEEDGLCGVTSNPSIFDKAIAGSHDYDAAIRALALAGKTIEEIYEALTVEDVQRAADLFRPVYDALEGRDGFVSLEVNPHLADDTQGTIKEARRLWARLNRPNVLIKVPATLAGLPAIQRLISEGINVNVTLLFSLPRYQQVAEAYLAGLEERAARGEALSRVASVASFFLSRIDALVDPWLEKIMAGAGPQARAAVNLLGEGAIACAKVAHCKHYENIFHSRRFKALAAKGARPQRLLWASTSTKNPQYSDVKYVESLIGPETVNTMPLETLNAYRDHGNPALRLLCPVELERAESILRRLPELGIDLGKVTRQLEEEGVVKFNQPYDSLMCTLEGKRLAALKEPVDLQTLSLGEYTQPVAERMAALGQEQFCARLWRKDPALWKTDPKAKESIRHALGWLHVAEKMAENLADLKAFTREVREAGFQHVVHMGMGGSSLAPLAFQQIFATGERGLPLTVLDTTDPATILGIERRLPLAQTLFIVASKSGTTAEPLAFLEYFYAKVRGLKGERAGENFVAITDPGTPMAKSAQERGFRRVFLNFTDIGGRYSALSYFGLVPAALMDLDLDELLVRALRVLHACASCVPMPENPGMVLGVALGELARRGRDKVTLVMPPALAALGMWLEQLLAESTGKEGTGLLPVAGEPLGDPSAYGSDRLFVYFRLLGEVEDRGEEAVAALRTAGQPVITITMEDRLDLGQEFFRWEVATATAGAVLGINPFDQPNVQESKDNTNRLLAVVREKGQLPEEKPSVIEGPLQLYFQDSAPTAAAALSRFLNQARPGDYLALLAYFREGAATEVALTAIRRQLRDRLHLATTLGYGPRYLHSTGQLHKGGPNTGLFLELTADNQEDAQVPGRPCTFGIFKQAQALGDLEALRQHGRRVMRLHLGADVGQGLAKLGEAVAAVLALTGFEST
jgi:transaldolase/glucose-6-phosphate isomerase